MTNARDRIEPLARLVGSMPGRDQAVELQELCPVRERKKIVFESNSPMRFEAVFQPRSNKPTGACVRPGPADTGKIQCCVAVHPAAAAFPCATNDARSRRPPSQRGTTALSGRTPG